MFIGGIGAQYGWNISAFDSSSGILNRSINQTQANNRNQEAKREYIIERIDFQKLTQRNV